MKISGKRTGIFLFLCLLINCKPEVKLKGGYCYPEDSTITDVYGIKKDSNSFYLPTYLYQDSMKIKVDIDSFQYVLTSLVFSHFHEPVYYNIYLGDDRYRLLEIPSYYTNPYLITIYKHDNKYYVQGQILKVHIQYFYKLFEKIARIDTSGNIHVTMYDALKRIKNVSGFISKDLTKEISEREWNEFIDLLNTSNFWKTKPYVKVGPKIDGSDWILEGHEENRYWYVMNNNDEVCDYLRKLSPIANYINRTLKY